MGKRIEIILLVDIDILCGNRRIISVVAKNGLHCSTGIFTIIRIILFL